jgi:hypothetical protein
VFTELKDIQLCTSMWAVTEISECVGFRQET